MPFKSNIWDDIREIEIEFTNVDESTKTFTLNEVRDRLKELVQKYPKFRFDEIEVEYEFEYLLGKVNYFMNQNIEEYFPSYKNCDFRVEYKVYPDRESYHLVCLFNGNSLSIDSKNLENEYEKLKPQIDDGSIVIK